VGSALVKTIEAGLENDGKAGPNLVKDVLSLAGELAAGVRR